MRKTLLAISIIGSMRIGSVFAISLDSSNVVSLGCPTDATFCNLSNMNIDSIGTNTFINHTNLTGLVLSNNNISSLEAGDFNGLSNVGNLNLDGNDISSLEAGDLDGLSNLVVFSIENNQLTSIGANTFNGKSNVKQIFARYNKINGLGANSFAGLPNLLYLELGDNEISFIDTGAFIGAYNLTNLYLRKNKLREIKDGGVFSDLESLYILDLRGNWISSIESGDFIGLSKLQTLYLGSNQLQSIEADDFVNLPLLYSLNLSNNQISFIEAGSFYGNLRNINLSFNEIISIGDGLFDGLNSLGYLYLHNNKIESINESTFVDIPQLVQLDLDHNNIISNPGNILYNSSQLFQAGVDFGYNCKDVFSRIYFNQDLYYNYINGGNCGDINSINPNNFVSALTGVGYTGDISLLIGTGAIKFASPTTSKFLVKTIMFGLKKYGITQGEYIPPHTEDYYLDPVEIEYPINTKVSQNGVGFTGVLNAPTLFNPEHTPGLTGGAISVIRFGSLNGKVDFDKNITIRIPARGKSIGEVVSIFSSEDSSIYATNGANWTYEKTGIVISLSGNSYVEFTTNHASWWALSSLPDTTPPIGTISYSTTNQTNGDVIATVTLNETGTVTSVGGNKHTFTQNGSFIFTFTDTAGNIGSAVANVTWITPSTINLFEVNSGNIVSLGCPITGTVCDLSNKKITSIAPNTFINHTQLTGLYINFNFLTEIKTDVFYGLSTLKELTLYGNKISSIESGDFNGLPNLSGLNMGSNSITKIESGVFSKLSNLKMLDLHINKIQTIESGGFMGLSNLTNLVLYQNYLTGISRGQFAGLSKLQELDIHYYPNFYDSDNNFITQYNAIRSIESGSFIGLSALKTIYLELNDINTIEVGDFAGLSNLQYLDLGANQINYIESGSFNTLTNLKGIIYNTGSMIRQQGLRFHSNCLDENSQNYISSIPDKRDNLGTSTVAETQKVCIAITYNTYSSTSGNVIGTLVFTGGTEAQRNAISADNPNLGSHTRTKNGTYSFDLTTIGIVNPYPNLWGWYIGYPRWDQSIDIRFAYKKILTGDVTWIRNTTPSISYSSTDPISGNVVATLSLSSGGTITSMGGNTHTFTQNGSFTFTFTDTAGNTGSATATVNNITTPDTTPPTATVSYSTTAPTNGSVIATITLSEAGSITNNGGINSYTFTNNGSFTFTFVDLAGNTGSVTATVNNITTLDTTPPTATISYSTTAPTNGSVIATITLSEAGSITNNGGSNSYTFADNGSFTFTFVDLAGNTGSVTATVNNITIIPIPTCYSISPGSGSEVTTNPLIFYRKCYDGSGITNTKIQIYNILGNLLYSQDIDTNYNSFSFTGDAGTYYRNIEATNISGNKSNMAKQAVIYNPPFTIEMINTGILYNNIYYINTGVVDINLYSNGSFYSLFSGEFVGNDSLTYNTKYRGKTLTFSGEGARIVTVKYFSAQQNGSLGPVTYYIDTTKPIISGLSPTSGSITTDSSIVLSWSGTDKNSGISSYDIQITSSSGIIVYYDTTTNTSISVSNLDLGTYHWGVVAKDMAGNTAYSSINQFTIRDTPATTPNNFAFTSIRDAFIEKKYLSNTFTVSGLGENTQSPISISNGSGTIIKNNTNIGVSGYVVNGDIIQLQLTASDEYNTTISSTLNIGDISATFSITTREDESNDCSLSNTEKYKIANMFELLKDSYKGTSNKWINMLYILQSMTEDIQDFDYNCSLGYLTNLVENEIEDGGDNSDNGDTEIDESAHTAPNCKEYSVEYNEDMNAYTSSDIKKTIYFASRNTLTKFIDSQNPGDCHINIYTDEQFEFEDTDEYHVAPNGKIYTIEEKDGYYLSPTMSNSRQFDTLESLTEHIDKYNPPFEIRDHEVDTDVDPIEYTAPNNKEYKIYKTDQGYMSYKFLKVKYFDSLEDIEAFIDKNNPKK